MTSIARIEAGASRASVETELLCPDNALAPSILLSSQPSRDRFGESAFASSRAIATRVCRAAVFSQRARSAWRPFQTHM
jgi:hypothetical protein